jgi:putative transposase
VHPGTDGRCAQSWTELLLVVKRRGLAIEPKLAIRDGALGFWKRVTKVFPATKEQRWWVHKAASVLDKLPKAKQAKVKNMIHEIWMSETKAEAA